MIDYTTVLIIIMCILILTADSCQLQTIKLMRTLIHIVSGNSRSLAFAKIKKIFYNFMCVK